MKIHFWGVRGSVPTPGPDTVRYGGNTLCVSIALDDDHTLVLDAGTGLVRLGNDAGPDPHSYYLLLSHVHWDHIQGFPMFRQHMRPDVKIRIMCPTNPDWGNRLLSQLDGVNFPIRVDELAADVSVVSDHPDEFLSAFGVSVTWLRTNHRGECFSYRIQTPTRTLLYVTDHEMDATQDVHTSMDELAAFCSGADILIHDAQFTNSQMPEKKNYGHSTVERVCELASKADVGHLVLFHHDPLRTDDMLDDCVTLARASLKDLGSQTTCEAAYEGLELAL